MNVKRNDRVRRYLSPVVGATVMVALMAWIIGMFIWAFAAEPEKAPPLGMVIVLIAIPAVVIIGVLISLIQRFREIGRGELDEASKY